MITSALSPGARLHRCAVPLASTVDPVAAAAALRPAGRVMLTAGPGGRDAVLAAGELAVLSHPGGDGPAPLTAAVDLLAGLDLPPDTTAAEAAWYGFLAYDAARDFERLPSRHPANGRPVYEFFLPEVLVTGGRVIGRGTTPAAARKAAEQVALTLDRLVVAPLGAVAVGTGTFGFGYDEYVHALRPRPAAHPRRRRLPARAVQPLDRTGHRGRADRLQPADLDQPVPVPLLVRRAAVRGRRRVAGAVPDAVGGRALIRPLAGTRPRGTDGRADRLIEDELRSSVKELAEHRMLVDLARNDLGRVCRPGSVRVERLMAVERYSHVMHLTSDVLGQHPRREPDRRADPGDVPGRHHDRHAQGPRDGDHRRSGAARAAGCTPARSARSAWPTWTCS